MTADKIPTEKIKAHEVRVGDVIALNGVQKPAFTVVRVETGHSIMGVIKAVRIEVTNAAGLGYGQNFALNKPIRRNAA